MNGFGNHHFVIPDLLVGIEFNTKNNSKIFNRKRKTENEKRSQMNSSCEYNLMSAEKRSLQCSTAIAATRLLLLSRELQQAREAGKSNHLTFCLEPTQNAP